MLHCIFRWISGVISRLFRFVYNWTLKLLRKCYVSAKNFSKETCIELHVLANKYFQRRANENKDEWGSTVMSAKAAETNVPIIPPLLDRNKTQTKIHLAFMKNAVVSVFFGRKKRLWEEGKTMMRRREKRRRFFLFAVIFSARHYPEVLSRVRPNEQNAFDGHDWPV